MLNFYRRFLPDAASTQASLHDAFADPRIKGSHPITWTPDLYRAFEECKASLSRTALLAHPNPSAPLALVTDASTSALGAVLQQRVHDAWQPLAFFSKKLNSAQQKYSAYDRELLAVYEAVKHFRHMLEARHFTIFTDHKPIIYAFEQKRDNCSPRQFNHLDFTTVSIYCDASAGKSRPYIPAPLRLQMFESVHNLSHPGTKITAKLIAQRFVWPSVQKDCRILGNLWEVPMEGSHIISPVLMSAK
jgi:hypothetical protein